MIDMMEHTFSLRKLRLVNYSSLEFTKNFNFFLVIIINCYIFVLFEIEVKNQQAENNPKYENAFMSICGLVLLIVSSIMIVLQLLVNTKLIIMDNLRNEMLEYKKILAQKLSSSKKEDKEIA